MYSIESPTENESASSATALCVQVARRIIQRDLLPGANGSRPATRIASTPPALALARGRSRLRRSGELQRERPMKTINGAGEEKKEENGRADWGREENLGRAS